MKKQITPKNIFQIQSRYVIYGGSVLTVTIGIFGLLVMPVDNIFKLMYPIIGVIPGLILGYFAFRENKIKFGYDDRIKGYPDEVTKVLSYLRSKTGKTECLTISIKILTMFWAGIFIILFWPYINYMQLEVSGKNIFNTLVFSTFWINVSAMVLALELEANTIVKKWEIIQKNYEPVDIDNDEKFIITDDERRRQSYILLFAQKDELNINKNDNKKVIYNGINYFVDFFWAVALARFIIKRDIYSLIGATLFIAIALVKYFINRVKNK